MQYSNVIIWAWAIKPITLKMDRTQQSFGHSDWNKVKKM